jgi:hypothetical protein
MVNLIASYKYGKEFYNHFKDIKSQDNSLFDKYKEEIFKTDINNIKIPDFDLAFKYAYLMTQVFSGTGLKESTKMIDLKGKYKSKFDSFRGRLLKPVMNEKLSKIKDVYNLDFEKLMEKLDDKETTFYCLPENEKIINNNFESVNIGDIKEGDQLLNTSVNKIFKRKSINEKVYKIYFMGCGNQFPITTSETHKIYTYSKNDGYK